MTVPLRRPTLRDRLRYRFDGLMSRGTVALIAWLWLLSLALILSATIVVYLAGIHPGASTDRSLTFVEIAWLCLMRTLDGGTMGQDQGSWAYLFAMLFVTSGGLLIMGTLIGILSAGIDNRLQEMRKGRSFVVEENHVVILGWSEQVFLLVHELLWAGRNRGGPPLVILAPRDKVAMEDELRKRMGSSSLRSIVCRTGDPLDLKDLEIVNPHAARAIAVLPTGEPAEEAQAVQTILSLTGPAAAVDRSHSIVTIVHDDKTEKLIETIAPGQVQCVHADDLVARLIAQTCRQPGLAGVYHELLTFVGSEIYFVSAERLAGRTFGESLLAFAKAIPLGLRRGDGKIALNPPMTTPILRDDTILLLAEESEDTDLTGIPRGPFDDSAIPAAHTRTPRPRRAESVLMLGWNSRASRILHQLDHYVVGGSRLVVASDNPMVPARLRDSGALHNLSVEHVTADVTQAPALAALGIDGHDHVILLGDSDRLEPGPADSRSLVSLLHLKELVSRAGRDVSVMSEILDARNRQIFDVTRLDDFVLSGQVASLMMAQIIQNFEISRFFDALFDPTGSEFYLKPAELYVELARTVDFTTVIRSAREHGEVAIGYRLRSDPTRRRDLPRMVLNPKKRDTLIFSPGDRIAVLAEN